MQPRMNLRQPLRRKSATMAMLNPMMGMHNEPHISVASDLRFFSFITRLLRRRLEANPFKPFKGNMVWHNPSGFPFGSHSTQGEARVDRNLARLEVAPWLQASPVVACHVHVPGLHSQEHSYIQLREVEKGHECAPYSH